MRDVQALLFEDGSLSASVARKRSKLQGNMLDSWLMDGRAELEGRLPYWIDGCRLRDYP